MNEKLKSKNIKFIKENITYSIVIKENNEYHVITAYIPPLNNFETKAIRKHLLWITHEILE